MNINTIHVCGNLTRDPELKALASGGSVASFGIATNRAVKKPDGSKGEETEFHNIVVFGKLAETFAQRKGGTAYCRAACRPARGIAPMASSTAQRSSPRRCSSARTQAA